MIGRVDDGRPGLVTIAAVRGRVFIPDYVYLRHRLYLPRIDWVNVKYSLFS